jgi:hypothetical protein
MNQHLGNRFIVAILVAVMGGLPTMAQAAEPTDATQPVAVCTFPMHAQVYQGTNRGLILSGNVTISIEASGNAFGVLAEEDGSQRGLVGQVTGRMIALLMDVDGDHVSGFGVADNDVQRCGFTTIVGALVGPAADDSGSWSAAMPANTLAPQ